MVGQVQLSQPRLAWVDTELFPTVFLMLSGSFSLRQVVLFSRFGGLMAEGSPTSGCARCAAPTVAQTRVLLTNSSWNGVCSLQECVCICLATEPEPEVVCY